MNARKLSLVAVVVAAMLPICSGAADQSAVAAGTAVKAAAKWKQPKTPWGDPDLQAPGPSRALMSVPLERPPTYGTRLYFTEEEMAQQRKAVETQNAGYKREESTGKLAWATGSKRPTFPRRPP